MFGKTIYSKRAIMKNGLHSTEKSGISVKDQDINASVKTLDTTNTHHFHNTETLIMPNIGVVDVRGAVLRNVADPVEENDAVNKSFLNKKIQTISPKMFHDSVTGELQATSDINMKNCTIKNVKSPTNDGDCANRLYVDTQIRNVIKTNGVLYSKSDKSNLEFFIPYIRLENVRLIGILLCVRKTTSIPLQLELNRVVIDKDGSSEKTHRLATISPSSMYVAVNIPIKEPQCFYFTLSKPVEGTSMMLYFENVYSNN
jgi:hypothetical protein